MTQWRLFSNGGQLIQHGGEGFLPIFGETTSGSSGNQSATESDVQTKAYLDYTFSDLRVNASLAGPSSTFSMRDDGANLTDLNISITGTGWFETIASAAVAADSLVNFYIDATLGMHNDVTEVHRAAVTYEHASTDAPLLGGANDATKSSDSFAHFGTSSFFVGNETNFKIRFKRSQILSNLRINCVTADTLTSVFALRKDGVTSTSVTMSVNGTGIVEDVIGSESYSDGDDGNFIWDFSAGSGIISVWQTQMNTPETFLTCIPSNIFSRVDQAFGGDSASSGVLDDFPWRGGSSTTAFLQCRIVDAGGGTRDLVVRVGSTNSTNLKISFTTTGFLEDATGTEAVGDTDSIKLSMISDGGVGEIGTASIELPWSDPGEPEPSARRVMITSD